MAFEKLVDEFLSFVAVSYVRVSSDELYSGLEAGFTVQFAHEIG